MNAPALPLTLHLPGAGVVTCTRALRVLPGRRWVLAGGLEGRAVVVKLFLAADSKARRHYVRERAAALALAARAAPAPALLSSGALDTPAGFYLLTAELPGAQTVAAALTGAAPPRAVLPELVRTLAALHQAGIAQADPHLDNFLWDGMRVYALDPGGLRVRRAALAPRASWQGLVRLLAELPLDAAGGWTGLAAVYASARGWLVDARTQARCARSLAAARRRRARRYAAKARRSCGEFRAERDLRHWCVVDRSFDTPALRALLADPDAAFGPAARWLKRGRSAWVVRLRLDGRELVFKRLHARSLARLLRRALRPSRAARAWAAAQRLRLFGVPVARPLAVLERRCAGLRGRAYLLTEFTAGTPFPQALEAADAPQRAVVLRGLRALLDAFAALGLSHGDLKASNVLITEAGALALDLDAVRSHATRRGLARALARDRARLARNLDHAPALRDALAAALAADAGTA